MRRAVCIPSQVRMYLSLVTEGATPREINRNVEEALQGLLEVWADLGMDLAPGTIRSIIRQLGISREEFGPIK